MLTHFKKYKFLFIESFFGGSHKNFAQGLVSFSKHNIDLVTMPYCNWKWRMQAAALYFVKTIPIINQYDGIIVTDLINLCDLKALIGKKCPPILLYFHENQITYPSGMNNQIKLTGLINIKSALVADKILFNSKNHLKEFLNSLPIFLKRAPDYKPNWIIKEINHKSNFLYPGCQFRANANIDYYSQEYPPLIIWNHRWSFDKNAKVFFTALNKVIEKGIDFNVALLGENFNRIPEEFKNAQKQLKERIVQFGYVESREQYIQWLKKGTVVVSTAKQENFGISVIEAMRYGCLPVLPFRLSYPEILPSNFHNDFLYKNHNELIEKLCFILLNYNLFKDKRIQLIKKMSLFAWENMIDKYDNELEKLVQIS